MPLTSISKILQGHTQRQSTFNVEFVQMQDWGRQAISRLFSNITRGHVFPL